MNIKVCDAICGSGKTSACIRMMNERTDTRFIFVTQFLSEVERIKTKCASREFISPDGDIENGKTKLSDIRRLLNEGRNIATTHALFVSSTEDIKRAIQDHHYVLVLDETVEVLSMSGLKVCDMNLLLQNKIIAEEEDGRLSWKYDPYEKENYDGEGKFSEEISLTKSKNLLKYDDEYFFWSIPPELFSCFQEVYVLTYLFDAQILRCFFDLYKLNYEYIGTKYENGVYSFCDAGEMNRSRDLRNKIHILEHPRMNEIGEPRVALSYSYYSRRAKSDSKRFLDRMRKNLNNLFKNIYKARSTDVMWTTYKEYKEDLEDRGFRNAFVVYNKRASNEYAHKHYLAYCVNNFMRPWEVNYFKEKGVEIDQDIYSLSILVQWIFRSAIRNGEEIYIYIPSSRMRSLLYKWLDNLSEGKDNEFEAYKLPPAQHMYMRKRANSLKSLRKGANE